MCITHTIWLSRLSARFLLFYQNIANVQRKYIVWLINSLMHLNWPVVVKFFGKVLRTKYVRIYICISGFCWSTILFVGKVNIGLTLNNCRIQYKVVTLNGPELKWDLVSLSFDFVTYSQYHRVYITYLECLFSGSEYVPTQLLMWNENVNM